MEFELIDCQDWHTEEDYPQDLDEVCALTHMGMYLAWAAQRQLLHPAVVEQLGGILDDLAAGRVSGRDIVERYLGKQLLLSFFNDLGRRFTEFYYADEEDGYGQFLADYVQTLRTDLLPSFYHVDDSTEAFAAVAAQFDWAYERWLNSLRDTQ